MSSAASVSASQLDITYGCLFLALVIASALWGIGTLQLYLYYEKYWKTDQGWLKAYLLVAWMFDTVHQGFLMDQTYLYFVRSMGDPSLLISVPKTVINNVLVTAFLDIMVQGIFVRRVWYISNKNRLLTGILSTAVLGLFVTTTFLYAQMYNFTEVAQIATLSHTEIALNSVVATTDTLLSLVLIWLLWKSRSGIKRTDSIVTKLVIYTVTSGFVTAIWAILALVSVAVAPHSFIYLFADLVIPKLYFNCMLASLNARTKLRATPGQVVNGVSMHLENITSATAGRSNVSTRSSRKVQHARVIECRVDIDIEPEEDHEMKFGRSFPASEQHTAINRSSTS